MWGLEKPSFKSHSLTWEQLDGKSSSFPCSMERTTDLKEKENFARCPKSLSFTANECDSNRFQIAFQGWYIMHPMICYL